MFDLIKSVIWIVVIIFLGYYIMGYFGYEINSDYFSYSKKECQERINECAKSALRKGLDSVDEKCNFNCVDPDLIINKKK